MAKKKTILILTIGFGAGHLSTAEAVRQSCESEIPEFDSCVVDVTPMLPWWFRWFYVDVYHWVLRYFPWVWRHFERHQREQCHTAPLRVLKMTANHIQKRLGRFDIAGLVSTEVGVNEIAEIMKRKFLPAVPLFAVLTDYDVDRAWIQDGVSVYCAGSSEVVEELVAKGAPVEKVRLTGIPVDPNFVPPVTSPPPPRGNVSHTPAPHILLAGGGEGLVDVENILMTLDGLVKTATVEVCVGKNNTLHKRLQEFQALRHICLVIQGWTEEMYRLLQSRDMLISKPGGITLTEAMASGIPLLACFPLPGSEVKHCALVEKWKIGLAARTMSEFETKARRMLSDPELRKEFSENSRRLFEEQHAHPFIEPLRLSLGLASSLGAQLRLEFNNWARMGRGERMEEHHSYIAREAIEQMHLAPADQVLDLGCGTGWAARRMAGMVPNGRVWGIDISDEMIERARDCPLNPPQVNFQVGSADSLPFSESQFDKVFSCESFYYYPDPECALREIQRVLVPDGTFYCLVNLFKENPYTHIWVELLEVRAHLLGAQEYEKLFRKSGFVNVMSSKIPDRTPVDEADFKPGWGVETIEDLRAFRAIGALLVVGKKPGSME
jgi:processive 1,2-diacylglycerol beta-glucosyltransferase